MASSATSQEAPRPRCLMSDKIECCTIVDGKKVDRTLYEDLTVNIRTCKETFTEAKQYWEAVDKAFRFVEYCDPIHLKQFGEGTQDLYQLWEATCLLTDAKSKNLHGDARFLDLAQKVDFYFGLSRLEAEEPEWKQLVVSLLTDATSGPMLDKQLQSFTKSESEEVSFLA